jgi:hypothetical protein
VNRLTVSGGDECAGFRITVGFVGISLMWHGSVQTSPGQIRLQRLPNEFFAPSFAVNLIATVDGPEQRREHGPVAQFLLRAKVRRVQERLRLAERDSICNADAAPLIRTIHDAISGARRPLSAAFDGQFWDSR